MPRTLSFTIAATNGYWNAKRQCTLTVGGGSGEGEGESSKASLPKDTPVSVMKKQKE